MIIDTVAVLNYRCLRSVRQKLRSFQILIGPNASGKSTFLDVFVFLQDLLREDLSRAVQKRARSLRELVWGMKSDQFEVVVELLLPENLRGLLKDYTHIRYEVRIGTDSKGGLTLLVENVWLLRKNAGLGNGCGSGPGNFSTGDVSASSSLVLEPKKRTPSGYRKVMSRMADGRVYVRSETTQWNFPLHVSKDRAGLMLIPETEERFPASVWLRRTLTEELHFLMLNSLAMRWPCRPDAPRTFQPDGSNLPILIEALKEEPSRFEHWVDHIRTVFPWVKSIKVKERQEDRYRYVVLETQDEKELPSWLLSDGTLRLFALTLLAYLSSNMGIYLIEEPENGVHPRALEAIYQSLSSIYGGQVFCATHSPILLNIAQPHELLCFFVAENGCTRVVAGDKHPRLKEGLREVALGDLLASGVLG